MTLRWCVLAFALWAPLATAADADFERANAVLHEQLTERWFEVEVLVFERLDVLAFNNAERLVARDPRTWPAALREPGQRAHLDATGDDGFPQAATTELLIEPGARCIGYPTTEFRDPVHPRLLARELIGAELEDALKPWRGPLGQKLRPATAPAPDAAALTGLPESQPGQDSPDANSPVGPAPEIGEAPPDPQALAQAEFQAAFDAWASTLVRSNYVELPPSSLVNAAQAINRYRHLRPVLHHRWRQAVPERDAPQPVLFMTRTEGASVHGLEKVEGHVAVTVGRYLHAAVTLWYHADNLGEAPLPLEVPLEVPLKAPLELPLTLAPSEAPGSQVLTPPAPYMMLQESRRMRSAELHYLDHPKLGILIRIDPVEPPIELAEAWLALESE